jgi:hypothetical protein
VSGAGAVVALVLLEWSVGWIGAAAWTQSWAVVKRGHFRISAWGTVILGGLALAAYRSTVAGGDDGAGPPSALVVAFFVLALVYAVVQYSNTDLPAIVVGAAACGAGVLALALTAGLVSGWPPALAALELVAGAALLGAVTNGMMLGHWYLNQPGLKPWALARLTSLAIGAVVATGVAGVAAAGLLSGASTTGAELGLPGAGESLGIAFFVIWAGLVAFTGAVVWAARRCIAIRSIQSATGLYYVALLTAGVSEFVVRYLMVNAA